MSEVDEVRRIIEELKKCGIPPAYLPRLIDVYSIPIELGDLVVFNYGGFGRGEVVGFSTKWVRVEYSIGSMTYTTAMPPNKIIVVHGLPVGSRVTT